MGQVFKNIFPFSELVEWTFKIVAESWVFGVIQQEIGKVFLNT